MRMLLTIAPALVVASFLPLSGNAAITIGGTEYVLSGPSEDLRATFGPSETSPLNVSANQYFGFVQVVVRQFGQSLADDFNDAFYLFADGGMIPIGPTHDPDFYQLAFDTSPIFGEDGDPTPASQLAKNSIVYDVDADIEVSSGYVPAYRGDHTYTIVLDTSLAVPGELYFGVSDGLYGDNSGHYDITIGQMVPVPEPTTVTIWGALVFVLVGLAGARHARRRSA